MAWSWNKAVASAQPVTPNALAAASADLWLCVATAASLDFGFGGLLFLGFHRFARHIGRPIRPKAANGRTPPYAGPRRASPISTRPSTGYEPRRCGSSVQNCSRATSELLPRSWRPRGLGAVSPLVGYRRPSLVDFLRKPKPILCQPSQKTLSTAFSAVAASWGHSSACWRNWSASSLTFEGIAWRDDPSLRNPRLCPWGAEAAHRTHFVERPTTFSWGPPGWRRSPSF